MTITSDPITSQAAGIAGRMLRLAEAGVATLASRWRAARNRRAVASLLGWDDRALSDIGLTPADVRSALAASPAEDASARLSALWHERRAAVRAGATEQRLRERRKPPIAALQIGRAVRRGASPVAKRPR